MTITAWLMSPSIRPNDMGDLRSGLTYAVAGALPGPTDVAAISTLHGLGRLTLTTAGKATGLGAVLGAGIGFTYGVHISNVAQSQSMGGQDVASQHAGSLIAEITNSGPSALSPHGSSVLPKGRRTVQARPPRARSGSQNFSRRRRRAPWCTLHKKSHWCANTRKTRK